MLDIVLMIVAVLTAIALTVLVVLQDNRGGGLAGVLAGAGGESAFGTETVSKVKKLTAYLGVLFLVVLLALAVRGQRGTGVGVDRGPDEAAEEAPAEGAGLAPTAPVPAEPAPAEAD